MQVSDCHLHDILEKKLMSRLARPAIIIGIGLILAFLSGALTYAMPPRLGVGDPSATAFFPTPTTTIQPQDASEIGSTDGIMALGGVIVLIVILPILLNRKSWMHPQ